MTNEDFGPLARSRFAQTIAQLVEMPDELYVHCPDCNAEGQVYATREGLDGWSPRGFWFPCLTCGGTKEADRELAIKYVHDFSEVEEPDWQEDAVEA